jgi:HEPN domain-containing protein
MLDEAEYARWINSSRKTLNSALGDLDRGDYNWACFKAQQAAELAVKALLHGLGLSAYGHSISRLLKEIPKSLKVQDETIQSAKTLDKYYVPTRYPNAWAEGTPEEYYTVKDAEEAVKHAEAIINWVESSWRLLSGGGG